MKLGRYVNHDPASWNYQAKRHPVASVMHQTRGLPFDQGDIGSCTANALLGALMTDPLYKGRDFNEQDARDLYHAETVDEGQPWPPNDPGGSGLEVCKVAKAAGLIKAYHHAFGVRHAIEALAAQPVITGINWYSSFDEPGAGGMVVITQDAEIRGGHEVVAIGMDVNRGTVTFMNSWGPSWGDRGRFTMTWSTWDRLLREQGDVTVPVV